MFWPSSGVFFDKKMAADRHLPAEEARKKAEASYVAGNFNCFGIPSRKERKILNEENLIIIKGYKDFLLDTEYETI